MSSPDRPDIGYGRSVIRSIKPEPLKRKAPLPHVAKKPWSGLAASVVIHGILVLLVFLTFRKKADDLTGQSAKDFQRAPTVDMVYLAQPVRTLPPPEVQSSRPAPNAIQAQENAPALSSRPPEDRPPATEQTEPEAAPPPPEPVTPQPTETFAARTKPSPEQPTLESEAQRIFGRPMLRQQQVQTQLGIRPATASDRDSPERTNCIPKPRDPTAPKEMAELVGRVYIGGNRPLAGAFLQIVGTAYSTYSDPTGLYRLVFDASLVDECRTQYVRVVAAGYRGRNLILGVGPGVNDVLMTR